MNRARVATEADLQALLRRTGCKVQGEPVKAVKPVLKAKKALDEAVVTCEVSKRNHKDKHGRVVAIVKGVTMIHHNGKADIYMNPSAIYYDKMGGGREYDQCKMNVGCMKELKHWVHEAVHAGLAATGISEKAVIETEEYTGNYHHYITNKLKLGPDSY